jgi:hypothetical protein
MKCPVCDKGEIVVDKERFYSDTFKKMVQSDLYLPMCNKCKLTFFEGFPTPEAAYEAMRPKVDEGQVQLIYNIINSMETFGYINNKHFLDNRDENKYKSFIKQELEKYYADR